MVPVNHVVFTRYMECTLVRTENANPLAMIED